MLTKTLSTTGGFARAGVYARW